MADNPRFWISPSQVARYYFHECDRYLRYRAASKEQRRLDDIPSFEPDRSLLTRVILDSGLAWEERILSEHLPGVAVIPEGDGPASQRRHGVEETMAALRDLEVGQYLYQPTLQAPPRFYERYGIDTGLVRMTDCFPDLVALVDGDDGPELVVIDAKASDMMKLAHRIQVGIYSLLLGDVIGHAGLADTLRVSRRGGVWLYEQPEPESFDLSRVQPPIETFLAHDLTRLLEAPAEDAFWHLYFRCEWCDYYDHCRQEAETTNDVSLVPYLSTFAKRHLRERAEVTTVDDLAEVLDGPDPDAVLDGCASLEGHGRRLRLAVDALRDHQVSATGAAAAGMPKGEQVRVVLTIQSDPLTGHAYGYAINRVMGADIYGSGSDTIARVAPEGSPEALADLRAALVGDLLTILEPVDRHNTANADDWWAQKNIQCYVFDTYERDLLVQTLLDAVFDEPVADAALTLLFHFQHPDLVQAKDQPATEVFFPLLALNQVVRGLMALPIPVVYRFADVVAELQPADHGFEYRADDFFSFNLSNRMKSNAIFEVWQRGRRDLIESIERELRFRVWAAGSVINGLRERLADDEALFAWPPKFRLPEGLGFNHPLLSRLAFIARYESVLEYLDRRVTRSRALDERLATGATLALTALGDDRFRADPADIELADLTAGTFRNHLLTTDTPAGRTAQVAYDDFLYRDRMYGPKKHDLALAAVKSVAEDGVIGLNLSPTAAFQPPVPGDRCFLEERMTDWNRGRLIEELARLDADPDPWFVHLVNDPVGQRHPVDVPPGVRDTALDLAGRHSMTPSQLDAFTGVLDTNLQLVWGPPGTGKTHFLALAVLCLAEAHRRHDLPLRVVLSAFTHTAIDNCLDKICELQTALGVVAGGLPVHKLEGHDRGDIAGLAHKQFVDTARTQPRAVFGTTVWQLRKIPPEDVAADLVLIDEGSQVTVGESAIAIRRVAPGGRLVIAGDPEQLPPIVSGDYPSGDDEPLLHRSILECLDAQDPHRASGLVAPLLENFRMNDVLCAYPAASIYPDDYRPATAAIGARRLNLGDPAEGFDDLSRLALDPAHPLVIAVLEDVQATRENPAEAAMVVDLTDTLRRLSPDLDDDAFWAERLFIVGPHHAQNRLIRRGLTDRMDQAYVDTVDKMQGQERDAVIVSYGVSDVEYALSESEFIYSRNRLNVAITRARVKTIVFLSRRLLEPPIQALDNDAVADGIAYMQGLARWCEERTEPITLDIDGNRLTILRA